MRLRTRVCGADRGPTGAHYQPEAHPYQQVSDVDVVEPGPDGELCYVHGTR